MANKCELGESYKDTVFLGTGKFYLRVGQSSYKELNLTAEEKELIKKVDSIEEAKDTGIYYNTSNSEIFFVVDNVPIELNYLKTSEQKLTDEQKNQLLKNLGLVTETTPNKLSFIIYNTKDKKYYFNYEDKPIDLESLISKYLTKDPSKGDSALREAIVKIINSEDVNFLGDRFTFSIKKNKVFDISNNITVYKDITSPNGYTLTGNTLTIDKINVKELNIQEEEINIPNISDLQKVIEEAKTEEEFNKVVDSVTEILKSSKKINFQDGDWTVTLPIVAGKINGYALNISSKDKEIYNTIAYYKTSNIDNDEDKFEKLPLEDKKKSILKILFPTCIYLKDNQGNEGNFNFHTQKSTDDLWAFGGKENKSDKVFNTKISKGQVIEFSGDIIDNLILYTKYLKCGSAKNSIIGVTEDSDLGIIENSTLIGKIVGGINFISCSVKCLEFIGKEKEYKYKCCFDEKCDCTSKSSEEKEMDELKKLIDELTARVVVLEKYKQETVDPLKTSVDNLLQEFETVKTSVNSNSSKLDSYNTRITKNESDIKKINEKLKTL